MREGIYTHGNLELVVRAEAERWGWQAEVENIDVDPIEPGAFGPRPAPGRGDVVLRRSDGDGHTFEYELPEDHESIVATIRQIVGSAPRDRARRTAPHQHRALEMR